MPIKTSARIALTVVGGLRRNVSWAIRLGLLFVIVVVWTSWATTRYLADLPATTADGQGLLFVWRGHDSYWWRCEAIRVALQTSLVLLASLLLGGVRRLSRGRLRANAAVAAVVVWLCISAIAVTVGSLATSYIGGSLTTVVGPGGVTRIVVQDEFDGDVVLVYRPIGRFRYLRESGYNGSRVSLDPRRGPCSITQQQSPTAKLVLRCGDTSYLLND